MGIHRNYHAEEHIDGTQDIPLATALVKGLMPVGSGIVTEFLNGAGGWTVPVGGSSITKAINQVGHSLSLGEPVKLTGSATYGKAQGDSSANAEVVGMVSAVAGADDFTLLMEGWVNGLTALGLLANTQYFLDPAVAGGLTDIDPLVGGSVGQVSKALLLMETTDAGYFRNMRGVIVPDLTESYLNGIYVQAVVNGDFIIAQRGSSGSASFTAASLQPNNDDNYMMDQWILLSDGNDVADVSQDSSAPTGSKVACKSLVATANKKWGFLQIIENKNAIGYRGQSASISFCAKTTTAKVINNIRAAIISWDGAEDAVTSDVVSAWGASGANPTLVANWTYENVPVNLALVADNYTLYEIDDISIDTPGMNNLAVFIWVDDTDGALNDELFLAEVQLNRGITALPFQRKSYQETLIDCLRYFQKSYNIETIPGTATVVGSHALAVMVTGYTNWTTVYFKVSMLITPTCYSWSEDGTIGNASQDDNSNIAASITRQSQRGFVLSATNTAGRAGVWFQWVAKAEL